MSAGKQQPQKGTCAICTSPIRAGDGVRWISLPGGSEPQRVHARCFDRDWDRLEAGLEPFPLRAPGSS